MLSTADLTWTEKIERLVGEMSQHGRHLVQVAHNLVGLRITSHKTGQVATFTECGEERDRENELVAVLYEPTPETLQDMPQLANVQVVLLND